MLLSRGCGYGWGESVTPARAAAAMRRHGWRLVRTAWGKQWHHAAAGAAGLAAAAEAAARRATEMLAYADASGSASERARAQAALRRAEAACAKADEAALSVEAHALHLESCDRAESAEDRDHCEAYAEWAAEYLSADHAASMSPRLA